MGAPFQTEETLAIYLWLQCQAQDPLSHLHQNRWHKFDQLASHIPTEYLNRKNNKQNSEGEHKDCQIQT